jgi:hypothetical protein
VKRQEAVLLLSRILTSCRPVDLTFISLDHAGSGTNSASEGYELHFKWSADDKAFDTIKNIVTSHNLGFREFDDGRLVIYTPKRIMDS